MPSYAHIQEVDFGLCDLPAGASDAGQKGTIAIFVTDEALTLDPPYALQFTGEEFADYAKQNLAAGFAMVGLEYRHPSKGITPIKAGRIEHQSTVHFSFDHLQELRKGREDGEQLEPSALIQELSAETIRNEQGEPMAILASVSHFQPDDVNAEIQSGLTSCSAHLIHLESQPLMTMS